MILLLLACATVDTGFPLPDMPDSGETGDTGASGPLELVATAPGQPIDECAPVCFTIRASRGGEGVDDVEIDVWMGDDALAADLETRTDGAVEACASGLEPGVHEVLVVGTFGRESASTTASFEVRPFGYAEGFARDTTPVESVPWTPTFTRHPHNPVLPAGEAGTWDEVGTIVPSVAPTASGWVMWYAGTNAEDYIVGVATSPDGITWTKDARNPLFTGDGVEGSWRRYSTNSPMVIEADGTWYMYYTGRSEETGNLNIGLATGASPVDVTDVPDNPVFAWTEDESGWAGSAVAHPSVLRRDDGWWEMWYSTGYHKVGYAYSSDGMAWNRYCKNPVFEGDPEALAWEANQVKATEVVRLRDWYYMTYTAGDTGAFTVGWAASRDGLHWVRADKPVLTPPAEPGTWESNSVLSAPIAVVGDELWMWYSGTGPTGSAVGLATAPLAGAP